MRIAMRYVRMRTHVLFAPRPTFFACPAEHAVADHCSSKAVLCWWSVRSPLKPQWRILQMKGSSTMRDDKVGHFLALCSSKSLAGTFRFAPPCAKKMYQPTQRQSYRASLLLHYIFKVPFSKRPTQWLLKNEVCEWSREVVSVTEARKLCLRQRQSKDRKRVDCLKDSGRIYFHIGKIWKCQQQTPRDKLNIDMTCWVRS